MHALSHGQAARTGQFDTAAAAQGRQQRMALAVNRRAQRDEDFGTASSLLRGCVDSPEQVHTLFHVLAQALQNNRPKPLDSVSQETILRLETVADELRYEVLG